MDNSTPVAGYEVEPQELSRMVEASGTVEPQERFHINAYTDGILSNVEVEEGDRVGQGELLAEVELAEHRAELGRVRAEVAKLDKQLQRKRPLVEQDAIQAIEIEQLEAEREIAHRQAEVWQTRIELGRMTAPHDAVVTKRHLDPGSSVAANEVVLELADVSTLVLPVRMSEREVVDMERDQSAKVVFDALPEQSWEATIRRVFPTADPDSHRVKVEFALDDVPREILPGFRARVRVELDRRPDTLAVPSESLLASEGDDEIVYAIEGDQLVERSVETGVVRRRWTEIIDGLDPGDTIVGANPTNLREGTRVHVSQWVGGQ